MAEGQASRHRWQSVLLYTKSRVKSRRRLISNFYFESIFISVPAVSVVWFIRKNIDSKMAKEVMDRRVRSSFITLIVPVLAKIRITVFLYIKVRLPCDLCLELTERQLFELWSVFVRRLQKRTESPTYRLRSGGFCKTKELNNACASFRNKSPVRYFYRRDFSARDQRPLRWSFYQAS